MAGWGRGENGEKDKKCERKIGQRRIFKASGR
jgi:hypothetical protein